MLTTEIQDDVNRHETRFQLYFQHTETRLHFSRHVMEHLNEQAPGRWPGHGSAVPTNVVTGPNVRDYTKNTVYERDVNGREELLRQKFLC
jgi:hypothetical protein